MKHDEMKYFVNTFLDDHLTHKDIVIDATTGNGHDTVYLAKLVNHVYAFDIQKDAIDRTHYLINLLNIQNVTLIHDSHENFYKYVPSFKAVIFNLGYLPKGNKSVSTSLDTTLKTLKSMLDKLENGFIIMTCYPGHQLGEIESNGILSFVKTLSTSYSVSQYQMLNKKKSPFVVIIEK